ncbi:REP-associated tyrosine transposase [Heyndrickxia camelliae]|uniref:Transposase n=1 Tax=Heyndrickxia camelliae TaxID=1707093 RepID=A0A2N3LP22_9BACI|nr:transposase [Heyndrickxia camelliae]PKR86370.1 transposase [Heyndrickxia camelliae]
MPRTPRMKSSNGIYHIMIRGINKQTIFEEEDDKRRMLKTIQKCKEVSKINLYAYCLMDNHLHLLLQETEESISKTMQRISASYVYWYNKKYERYGHLFQDRFKSEPVETDTSFLKVLRYIHQNPVKAGLTKNVFDCKWTSVNEYIRKTDLIDTDYGLCLFSKNKRKALKWYEEYMIKNNNDQFLDDFVRVKRSDSEVIHFIQQLGVENIASLQQMDKSKRNAIILELKELKGITYEQLSRVTGISKSVIGRVR